MFPDTYESGARCQPAIVTAAYPSPHVLRRWARRPPCAPHRPATSFSARSATDFIPRRFAVSSAVRASDAARFRSLSCTRRKSASARWISVRATVGNARICNADRRACSKYAMALAGSDCASAHSPTGNVEGHVDYARSEHDVSFGVRREALLDGAGRGPIRKTCTDCRHVEEAGESRPILHFGQEHSIRQRL